MPPDSNDPYRFKVRVLFGLFEFEADASGTVAICATVLSLVLVGAGRFAGILQPRSSTTSVAWAVTSAP